MAVLVACAKLLWAFDWSYAAGEQPDVSWETGYTSGLTVKPRGFQPVVRPRSAGKARRIVVEHDKSVKFMAEAPGPAEATQLHQENGREAASRPGDLGELRPTACDRAATLDEDGGGGGGYV
ncbi:hypothetical protein S40285_10019 [Stachybotrys chlorohalonatus IBT 40285]|uniref:Hypervirulence associated protein TUDOR domain-containing protein n=1 Tax=Stachybotrys chlorohalonatus (strain IBT 40285) TaxID=1283841 RepID=A0A084QVZ2_STAC4|nr:hypothetical protein S40285_10019 [Stachybotrys chlorohalonata IBT 40285]